MKKYSSFAYFIFALATLISYSVEANIRNKYIQKQNNYSNLQTKCDEKRSDFRETNEFKTVRGLDNKGNYKWWRSYCIDKSNNAIYRFDWCRYWDYCTGNGAMPERYNSKEVKFVGYLNRDHKIGKTTYNFAIENDKLVQYDDYFSFIQKSIIGVRN